MKVALAQLNYHIGNFEINTKKIVDAIREAKLNNADLIVFSELSVCGYPPLDLLEREDFVSQCKASLDVVSEHCNGIAAVVGCPSINDSERGKKLFNSAYFINSGSVELVQHKSLLPNYDIFDEYRYFEPDSSYNILSYKGTKIALSICEDIWDEQPVANSFSKTKLYKSSPIEELMSLKPDLLINIAASPFSCTQVGVRRKIVQHKSSKHNIPIVYVNQVGANTELVFDGGSMYCNAKGEVEVEANRFEEQLIYCSLNDTNSENSECSKIEESKMEYIHKALVLGVRDYFSKMGFKSATLGLSGGIDSAVTAVIAAQALGAENVHGVLMPSKYSSDHSVKDAEDLANNLGMPYSILPIKDLVSQFDETLGSLFEGLDPDVTEENIQARIRGVLLMANSNKFGHILLNTSNKSEAAVGYGTLYGDMNGGLSVLGDVYKTDVFELARYLNTEKEIIPNNTIIKPPSAELRPDQKDSDSLPDYDVLDAILFNFIEKNQSVQEIIDQGYAPEVVKRAVHLVNINEYKRYQTPPIIRVSSKAFGLGRRIPLVSKLQV